MCGRKSDVRPTARQRVCMDARGPAWRQGTRARPSISRPTRPPCIGGLQGGAATLPRKGTASSFRYSLRRAGTNPFGLTRKSNQVDGCTHPAHSTENVRVRPSSCYLGVRRHDRLEADPWHVARGYQSMPAASPDADSALPQAPLERAMSMLVKALEILDDQDVPPELGARLQGVIEDLREHRSA